MGIAEKIERLLYLANPTPGCKCATCQEIRKSSGWLAMMAEQVRKDRPLADYLDERRR